MRGAAVILLQIACSFAIGMPKRQLRPQTQAASTEGGSRQDAVAAPSALQRVHAQLQPRYQQERRSAQLQPRYQQERRSIASAQQLLAPLPSTHSAPLANGVAVDIGDDGSVGGCAASGAGGGGAGGGAPGGGGSIRDHVCGGRDHGGGRGGGGGNGTQGDRDRIAEGVRRMREAQAKQKNQEAFANWSRKRHKPDKIQITWCVPLASLLWAHVFVCMTHCCVWICCCVCV